MGGLKKMEKQVLDAIKVLTGQRCKELKSVEIANYLGYKTANNVWRSLSTLESYGFIVRTGHGQSRRIILTGGGQVPKQLGQPAPIHITEAQERIRKAVGFE